MWCLTSTETVRLIRDRGVVWRWGKREIEGDYISIATVTPRMILALRWAVMTAIIMFD